MKDIYFNPIIVLFLTTVYVTTVHFPKSFQSYYSLISNQDLKSHLRAFEVFQSYYSLISNHLIM